jgi:hypothetical protein
VIVLLQALLGGCIGVGSPVPSQVVEAPNQGRVTLSTDSVSYESPVQITLSLHNDSDAKIGYNLCLSDLQALREDEWRAARVPRYDCGISLSLLPPNDKLSYTLEFPEPLPPATYRFCADYRRMKRETEELREAVCTLAFDVR